MNSLLPEFLQSNEAHDAHDNSKRKQSLPFIDRTLNNIAGFIKTGYIQIDSASKKGLLQQINPRAKIIFLLLFIISIGLLRQIHQQLCITLLLFLFFITSRINIREVYKKIVLVGFFFGFLVAAPACLNIITHGNILFPVLHFTEPHKFWIYHLPETIGITREGCIVVIRFFLKVTNSVALTLLIFYSTSFSEFVKALDFLWIPQLFLIVILLTYKLIFILSFTTEETYLALKSRWWNHFKIKDANQIVSGRILFIFRKSWLKYEEINRAMISKGFSGKINFCYSKKLNWLDAAFLLFIFSIDSLIAFI